MASNAASSRTAAPAGTAASLWQRSRRWLVAAFGVLVVVMLISNAHKVDWAGAWQALKRYPPLVLLAALGLAAASHALYGCFDLIGRRHTRHRLGRWRTWAIGVTSYAFNLNLGSLVGGVAMRARLYARAGLDEATIAQIVGLSLATNWLGYGLLAGGLFAAGAIEPPGEAHLGRAAFRALGGGMVLVALGYVGLCAWSRGREWTVRGRRVHLPSARLAAVQIGVSALNWAVMGSVMWLLLGRQVPYATALGVLMAAAIVGVITPIPAGLGVLEAVYLSLLSVSVRQGTLFGAVLAYRAVYYLLPLAGGLVLYLLLERLAAREAPAAAQEPAPA